MSDYDSDIVAWSEHQARLLRRIAAGETVNDRIDWSNIIDEVETVGRSERSALRSHIGTVLEHLMSNCSTHPSTCKRLITNTF